YQADGTLSSNAGGLWAADLATYRADLTDHFVITAPASVGAGTPFTITVTATDVNGNTATGYTGTVHFTSSDGLASLPGNYTFTATDNGVHTFTNAVTLVTAGSQTITATDTVNGGITGSTAVLVNAAAANHLAFSQQPTNTAVGATISLAVTVLVQDQY